ncbi:MAG: hypothetical protein Q9181_004117 [Wetmoreana brouardii]
MEQPLTKRRKTSPQDPTLARAGKNIKILRTPGKRVDSSPAKPSSLRFYSVFYQDSSSRACLQVKDKGTSKHQIDEITKNNSPVNPRPSQSQPHSPADSPNSRSPESIKLGTPNGEVSAPGSNLPQRTLRRRSIPQDLRASPPEDTPAIEQSRNVSVGELNSPQAANTAAENSPPYVGTPLAQIPSTPTRHELDYTEDREPRLPSTPTQLGLEPPPKPPPGLLSWSSSKRTKMKAKRQSSALKPGDCPSRKSASPSLSPLSPSASAQVNPEGKRASKAYQDRPLRFDHVVFVNAKNQDLEGVKTTEYTSITTDTGCIPSFATHLPPEDLLIIKLSLLKDVASQLAGGIIVDELSEGAEEEFGPLLRRLAGDGKLDGIRQAIKQYGELSVERADCWARCEQTLHNIFPGVNAAFDREQSGQVPLPNQVSGTLRPCRGRQNLLLYRDETMLLINWKIAACTDGNLQRKLYAKVFLTTDSSDIDNVSDGEEVAEIFKALIDNGRDVPTAIAVLAQTVFADSISTI